MIRPMACCFCGVSVDGAQHVKLRDWEAVDEDGSSMEWDTAGGALPRRVHLECFENYFIGVILDLRRRLADGSDQ